MTGTNLDVVQEPRIRIKYSGHESVNVCSNKFLFSSHRDLSGRLYSGIYNPEHQHANYKQINKRKRIRALYPAFVLISVTHIAQIVPVRELCVCVRDITAPLNYLVPTMRNA